MSLLDEKENRLDEILRRLAPVAVAFSGGVDSSYLAYKAYRLLGSAALALTADNAAVSSHDREMADRLVRFIGIERRVVATNEIEREDYRSNTAQRCFCCKDEVYAALWKAARAFGAASLLDGQNVDDREDFRPGSRAALDHNVHSPLMEAGLTKQDIRTLSRAAGLPTANQPSSACLASRIPYGLPITEAVLRKVDRGEQELRKMGFVHCRVRHHEHLVRLEFGPEDFVTALNPETAHRLCSIFKELGYAYVTLDLEGYRVGSLNEVLRMEGER